MEKRDVWAEEIKKRHSTKKLVFVALLTALVTLLLTFFITWHITGMGSDLGHEAARFREARELITNRYVGVILDEGYLTDAAIAASVRALGDPWSRFLTQEQYEAHLRSLENRRQGIGVLIDRDEETEEIRIIDVMPGSPAEEAGLAAGDTILTVDGEVMTGQETHVLRDRVAERYGDSVRLELRDEAGEYREVEVEVRSFYVNPVSFELKEDTVGYIRITNFDLTSGQEAIAAMHTLMEDGAEGLIFDLRYNPGGRVDELLQLLDYLLPEGELFVFADYRGHERIRYAGPEYLDIPIVVLVNEWSASAAEFFAAIIQEKERGTIVGTPTTGKGRSQRMFPLSGGGAISLSTDRYLTPGRVDLYEAGGVKPDVLEEDTDAQLERALDLLLDK